MDFETPGQFEAGSSPLARGTLAHHGFAHHPPRFIPARAGNTRSAAPRTPVRPVHPRSRGEHQLGASGSLPEAGSSPLARGTPVAASQAGGVIRFIPARAGNTPTSPPSACATSVHPRSRGEHDLEGRAAVEAAGSSPLARGTRLRLADGEVRRRFIPARAGNTGSICPCVTTPTVHPRSRGEHDRSAMRSSTCLGSSSLARGTQPARTLPRRFRRFIPARAGNTRAGRGRDGRMTVHPRSRGEHCVAELRHGGLTGSSPLARGTLCGRAAAWGTHRFIPARAGNTTPPSPPPPSATVHPRSRGEHFRMVLLLNAPSGSSPLARGTRRVQDPHQDLRRFIPARAGNTTRRTSRGPWSAVHPRSRGEHVELAEWHRKYHGSSPLARGTPQRPVHDARMERFIPARAGNTRWSA